ncbi:MAG TPA: tetratricopeptide repeat protein [Ktedonobacterales bacterium]
MADEDVNGQEPENVSAEPSAEPLAPASAQAPRRAGVVTGWLRDALARLPTDSRPLSARPDPLADLSALAGAAPTDALCRATRAGEVIAALAPGAPSGVVAPEGAPRVARVLGRDERLEQALALLASGASLCVHSDGVPGAGKTVFAVEVASRAAAQRLFAGGVVWISCETLGGDAGLAEVITRVARNLREERALAALDPEARHAALASAIAAARRAPTLLALDNVEPTLDLAALLDTLAGGYLTLLVTARQAVDDNRLTSFALAPLTADIAERLFSERLRLRDARRPLDEEAPLIRQVAEALGGLPLALDLAAAMVGVYGSSLEAALAEAQEDSARGPAAALRARIDRQWRALTPEQQRTLAGLTLIEGATFPRSAALAVARVALDETTAAPLDTTERWRWQAAQALDALIGLGLVEAMAAGRLRLHPQTRLRIAPRLADMPPVTQDALGVAMAEWWLEYARGHDGYEGMSGLEAEAAGLMGALTWAHAHGRWRLTLDLAEALGDAWRAHGRRDEALHIYGWAAEAADAEGQPRERWWARYQLAVAQTEAGQLRQARAGFEAALRLARELADPVAIRDGAHALAALAARAGDTEQARASFTEALALARETDDPAAIRDELHGLAILDAQAGRLDEARAEYGEALELARALGDSWAIYVESYGLGLVEMRAGAPEQARAAFGEALQQARALGDTGAETDTLMSLGALDAQHGEPDQARDELAQALALAEEIGDARRTARALVWLAEIEAANGATPAASDRFQQARTLYERLGDAEAERVTERMRALGYAS